MSPRNPLQPPPPPPTPSPAGDVSEGACMVNLLNWPAGPAAGVLIVIGGDTYEIVNASPPTPSDPSYVGITRGMMGGPAKANIINAIHGVVDVPNIVYPAGGLNESFLAELDGANVRIVSADAPGGTRQASGTATACSCTALGLFGWRAAACWGGEEANATDQIGTSLAVEIKAGHLAQGYIDVVFPFQPTQCGVINRSRTQNESWSISGYRVRLTLAGGADPNNQLGDLIDFLAVLR